MKWEIISKRGAITIWRDIEGFGAYDKVLEMSIAMNCKTEQEALLMALESYQKRHSEVKEKYNQLRQKVEGFLDALGIDDVDF